MVLHPYIIPLFQTSLLYPIYQVPGIGKLPLKIWNASSVKCHGFVFAMGSVFSASFAVSSLSSFSTPIP
jgi:hypothetical protein